MAFIDLVTLSLGEGKSDSNSIKKTLDIALRAAEGEDVGDADLSTAVDDIRNLLTVNSGSLDVWFARDRRYLSDTLPEQKLKIFDDVVSTWRRENKDRIEALLKKRD